MNRRMFLTLPPLAAPLLLRAPLFAAGPSLPLPRQRIDCFGRHWLVQAAAEWKTESAAGGEVLQLSVARPQEANPRAPVQYALLEQEPAGCFTLDVEVQGSAEGAPFSEAELLKMLALARAAIVQIVALQKAAMG